MESLSLEKRIRGAQEGKGHGDGLVKLLERCGTRSGKEGNVCPRRLPKEFVDGGREYLVRWKATNFFLHH